MGRFVTMAGWDDAPHLPRDVVEEMYDELPEHEREARSKGIPSLGSGNVYQIPESSIKVERFPIPDWWPRIYGMDVGWNWTAVIWLTRSPLRKEYEHPNNEDERARIDADIAHYGEGVHYIYAVYKKGKLPPKDHFDVISSEGIHLPGLIDPGSAAASQKDGSTLLGAYRSLGLNLRKASNSVEGGIKKVELLLSSGNMKVFDDLPAFFDEYRQYRRTIETPDRPGGKVVKRNDHLLDALRYAVLSGLHLLALKAFLRHKPDEGQDHSRMVRDFQNGAWMV